MSKHKVLYRPVWAGAIEGHAVNTARRFYPALCAEHEFEDLLQEAFLVFMRCRSKYKVDSPQWFMVLFSTSLRNRYLNMKAKCGRLVSFEALEEFPEPQQEGMQFERLVMKELPRAIKWLIVVACCDPGPRGRGAFRALQEHFPALKAA